MAHNFSENSKFSAGDYSS